MAGSVESAIRPKGTGLSHIDVVDGTVFSGKAQPVVVGLVKFTSC